MLQCPGTLKVLRLRHECTSTFWFSNQMFYVISDQGWKARGGWGLPGFSYQDCAVLMSLIVISRAKLRAFGIVLGKRRPSWVTLPNCLSLLGGICSDLLHFPVSLQRSRSGQLITDTVWRRRRSQEGRKKSLLWETYVGLSEEEFAGEGSVLWNLCEMWHL